jgi:hypothetical protein
MTTTPGLLYPVEPGPRANHMAEADADLGGLTPEEKFLYNMHLTNLHGRGRLEQPNGAISSLIQMSFDRDGKTYNIPTLWGGKQLPPDDAIRAAEKVGLDKFPAYKSQDEAEARYQQLHDYLARDTGDMIRGNQPAVDEWPRGLLGLPNGWNP